MKLVIGIVVACAVIFGIIRFLKMRAADEAKKQAGEERLAKEARRDAKALKNSLDRRR